MGFAVLNEKEFEGIDGSQRSDVYMNSLFIHLVQLLMIYCVWMYAWTDEAFDIT